MSAPIGPIAGKNMNDLIRDVRAGKLKPADLPDGLRRRVVNFAKTLPADALVVPTQGVEHRKPLGDGAIRRVRSA